ncbi:MAG: hypothetical protein PHC61_18430 [Chitinivibrionales bacterium]|nr:hypothetical protein [Chitinivibrionales bacterium]
MRLRWIFWFVFLPAALLFSCGQSRMVAGGAGGETTNGIVATIVDAKGQGVSGIAVALVPSDFNPLKNPGLLSKQRAGTSLPSDSLIVLDTTDISGRVSIKIKEAGFYNLVATADEYKYKLFVDSVSVNADKSADTNLGAIPLKDSGTVLVSVDSSAYSAGNSVIITGSIITAPINRSGVVAIGAPAGIVSLQYVNATGDSIAGGSKLKNIAVLENQIINKTGLPDSLVAAALWSGVELGTPSPAGSFSASGNSLTVNGGQNSYFVFRRISGDFDITAHITGVSGSTNYYRSAGIGVRSALTPTSGFPRVGLLMHQTDGGFDYSANGLGTDEVYLGGAGWDDAHEFLRLSRRGNLFTARTAGTLLGLNDTAMYSQALTMPDTVYVGLEVGSAAADTLHRATFDNVSITVPIPLAKRFFSQH